MKYTNKYSLPEAVVLAVQNDPYSKGQSDFSVTELLKPPRQRALQIQHENALEEDVSDRLYSLYGQIAHLILERANKTDLIEKRFFITVPTAVESFVVSAQIDSLAIEEGILSDYKFTSAYGFMTTSEPKPEWVAQLNMQLEILRQNGLDAKALQIVGLIRDFSLRDSKTRLTYPKAPVVRLPLPMWTREETRAFILERISVHLEAMENLPACSKEETWNGRRCQDYCNVSKYCSQYQSTLKGE